MAGRQTTFVPTVAARLVNRHAHVDHWFWTRYSAYPYIGCQHGCEFCYCRARRYAPGAPEDFAHVITVKTNAAALLRRELSGRPRDVVFTGDYQPAERRYGLSRQLLEACAELGFPVFVLERAPLVTRDLDVLLNIQARAAAVVAFSILTTPDAPSAARVRAIERLTPAPEKRFAAMEKLAAAGIVTGTCLMPVLPGVSDDDATLESVVRWTAEHGGQFVLAGGLTLADQARDYFLGVLRERFSDLAPLYARLYPAGTETPDAQSSQALGRHVRELCARYGLRDRMPRPVIAGAKRALNQRVAEQLANMAYTLEITGAPGNRVWAYRRAAWAVDELEQALGLFMQQMGAAGLAKLPGVEAALVPEIVQIMQALSPT